MRSAKFYWGMLFGLIVGVGVTIVSQPWTMRSPQRIVPNAQPRNYVVCPGPPLLPPGWRPQKFNGGVYYLIPLAAASR